MKRSDFSTREFLRIVGSPLVNSNESSETTTKSQYYDYAVKNRIPLLYLEALKKQEDLGPLQKRYDELTLRHIEIKKAFRKIAEVLDAFRVNYAFFKSIRPYREITVDIDIIIFGSTYRDVVSNLRNVGYSSMGSGPLSTTFRDDETRINLDIYDEIGVSNLVYLDKEMLVKLVDGVLFDGVSFRSLRPEADLLAVIAHSIVKEHMYVLSEYFTTLHHISTMDQEALRSFLFITKKCRMQSSVRVHLSVTALLHREAYGFVPEALVNLLRMLGPDYRELSLVAGTDFRMPYKYHLATVVRSLIEKLPEKKARRSFAVQTMKMLNPSFAAYVVKNGIAHMVRETY